MFSHLYQAFDCSIRKDEHLAVAFFQRGITFYKKKRQFFHFSQTLHNNSPKR